LHFGINSCEELNENSLDVTFLTLKVRRLGRMNPQGSWYGFYKWTLSVFIPTLLVGLPVLQRLETYKLHFLDSLEARV
jgi:hypothetical protein